MRGRWSLAIAGVILIAAGGLLAYLTQTAGGIRIEDVRFNGATGNTMSALLYIPPNATAQTPAPGILAVHGYINSRETQDGFAIEFARRGYVVLAIDQTGHGYSDPPAFAKSKRAVEGALRGYKELNLRALHMIRPGGLLITCSCSHHVSWADLEGAVASAAIDAHRRVTLLERRGAAQDHPVLLNLPETEYLKCLICQVD